MTWIYNPPVITTTLADLTDTTISNPQLNDVFQWDGTKWINRQDLKVNGDIYHKTGQKIYYDA